MKKPMMHVAHIPIILGTIGAFGILILSNTTGAVEREAIGMDTASIVAIVIALLSVAGGVWVQILQFKKDSSHIGEVKSDTSLIKPQIATIDENTKKIRDEVIETLVPDMRMITGSVSEVSGKVFDLVADLEYRKRLQAEVAGSINKDYLLSGIEQVYKENAQLSQMLQEQREQNQRLEWRNNQLENDNVQLKKTVRSYETRYRDYDGPER